MTQKETRDKTVSSFVLEGMKQKGNRDSAWPEWGSSHSEVGRAEGAPRDEP